MENFAVDILDNIASGVLVYRIVDSKKLQMSILEKANKSAISMTKGDLRNKIGKPIKDIFPSFPKEYYVAFQEALESHKTVTVPDHFFDGTKIKGWFKISFTPLTNGPFIVTIFEEITDIKKSIEERQKLEQRLQAFITASPDMLHLITKDGVLLDTHKGTSGLEESVFTKGKNIMQIFPKSVATTWLAKIQAALNNGGIQSIEYNHIPLTNRVYEARFIQAGRDEVIVIVRDITTLKQAHAELEEMVKARTRQLEASNKALQSFAYAASHDLREPLNKISAFGARIKKEMSECPLNGNSCSNTKLFDYLGIMLKASSRLSALIDSLLDFSRAGGAVSAELESVDMEELIPDLLENLDHLIKDGNVSVTVQHPLPKIQAHYDRVMQIFQNLITNSIKFKKPDTNPIVTIGGYQENKKIYLWVKDEGIGFDPTYKEKIFEVFTRLHTRFEYPGTGIGLALCKRIVEQYDGEIIVESVPGQGAKFTVVFPEQEDKN
jgi:signal transduction histidine kinase